MNADGSGGAYPHFRFNAGANWSLGGFAAGVRTYFIGSYKECADADGELAGAGLCYEATPGQERWSRNVSAYNTWDLTFGYGFASAGGRTSISLGVINVLDQAPPNVYNGFANTTDTYSYDLVMRQFFGRLTHQF